MVVDEGDPFNEILLTKSINNLKSLNFFKDVTYKVVDGNDFIILRLLIFLFKKKLQVKFLLAAGIGTDGGSIGIGVKENNFLGEGIITRFKHST